jgi:hypothetical protein
MKTVLISESWIGMEPKMVATEEESPDKAIYKALRRIRIQLNLKILDSLKIEVFQVPELNFKRRMVFEVEPKEKCWALIGLTMSKDAVKVFTAEMREE